MQKGLRIQTNNGSGFVGMVEKGAFGVCEVSGERLGKTLSYSHWSQGL
jgi:hypothetical protein